MGKQCRMCGERERCRDTFTSWIFFLIGLVATISVRIVTILDSHHPLYGKIAWYIGVAGFFVFFIYKFKVDSARARLIRESRITRAIHDRRPLSPEEYRLIGSIFCSLTSKKDLVNYVFIFGTSILALVAALYFDIFGGRP